MHDLYETSADAAAVLIPELKNRGYQLVTVSELASYRGGMQPGHTYSRFPSLKKKGRFLWRDRTENGGKNE